MESTSTFVHNSNETYTYTAILLSLKIGLPVKFSLSVAVCCSIFKVLRVLLTFSYIINMLNISWRTLKKYYSPVVPDFQL